MIKALLIGICFVVAISVVWVLIQNLWKDVFQDEYSAEDALEGRRNCSNCGCTSVCKRKIDIEKSELDTIK